MSRRNKLITQDVCKDFGYATNAVPVEAALTKIRPSPKDPKVVRRTTFVSLWGAWPLSQPVSMLLLRSTLQYCAGMRCTADACCHAARSIRRPTFLPVQIWASKPSEPFSCDSGSVNTVTVYGFKKDLQSAGVGTYCLTITPRDPLGYMLPPDTV